MIWYDHDISLIVNIALINVMTSISAFVVEAILF